MAVAKHRSRPARGARSAKIAEPKATTIRLDPALKQGLEVLGKALKKPLNRLVNEAVRGFIEKRGAEVQADLERTIASLKAYRKRDPGFESAIAQFVESDASDKTSIRKKKS
jgi:predicted transcriptional regulator